MVNPEHIRLYQGLEKLVKHAAAMRSPHNVFLIDFRFKNGSFVSERDLATRKR